MHMRAKQKNKYMAKDERKLFGESPVDLVSLSCLLACGIMRKKVVGKVDGRVDS